MANRPFDADQAGAGKIQAAQAFLRLAMATGARPAAEVEAEARALGIAHATLAEARHREHIASKRAGAGWQWIPPGK